jgi:hypothetical protein
MRPPLRLLLTLALIAGLIPAGGAAAADAGKGSDNLDHVANLAYEQRYGNNLPYGTDLELQRIRGRDYAFAGTYRNGLQIIDVTDPTAPSVAAVYDCAIAQGDVQVFTQGRRVLAAYTADRIASHTFTESRCFTDLGITTRQYGTFLIDVTNPRSPATVSFVPIAKGSHNQTVHPSGRYLYNSNSEIVTTGAAIEIHDISDPADPRHVTDLRLDTGLESHDITFNADGTRAYSAALTHTLVIDTTDPERPEIIGRILDPAINIHHQADPVTITDPILGTRTFLLIEDELAGAAGNGYCPGGGFHIYDITGTLERTPLKVGAWFMPDTRPATDNAVCTAHVFRIYPEQALMTVAWYDAGVRVVDLSALVGVSLGTTETGSLGTGMAEIAWYRPDGADTWAFKLLRFEPDGSFYAFGNDINRGFDVYRFDSGRQRPENRGRWRTPAEAEADADARPASDDPRPWCLLPVG